MLGHRGFTERGGGCSGCTFVCVITHSNTFVSSTPPPCVWYSTMHCNFTHCGGIPIFGAWHKHTQEVVYTALTAQSLAKYIVTVGTKQCTVLNPVHGPNPHRRWCKCYIAHAQQSPPPTVGKNAVQCAIPHTGWWCAAEVKIDSPLLT